MRARFGVIEMTHYDYHDTYSTYQRLTGCRSREEMYRVLNSIGPTASRDLIGFAHLQWEEEWFSARRPFYRVWPSIIPMLLKLDLSKITAASAKLPIDNLLIQLPVGNGLGDNGRDLHYIMAGSVETRKGPGTLVGSVDGSMNAEVPLVDMWLFERSDDTLAETLNRLRQAAPLNASTDVRDRAISLVTTLCLLDSDPELISPVLLAADAAKATFTKADLQRMIDRARKRGRIGWDVGKGIEVVPHYRRPHPALMWTGEGRKVPRIVLRKGAVVHRSKVETIPTGYQDDLP
jgi:hypothetical protein